MTKYHPIANGGKLFVGATAPAGVHESIKNIWLDTSSTAGVLKVWNGSAWSSAATDVETFATKTFTDDSCIFGAVGALTKTLGFVLSGATADTKMTIASSQTEARTLTLPDATDTLVGKATTDTLTNKTLDCDGTGNVVSNVNANELDPVAGTTGTYAVSFIIPVVNAGAASVSVFNANAPFKFRVLDAWSRSNKASNSGTWKLSNGTNDVTAALAYNTGDNGIARLVTLDDAYQDIAANGTLNVVNTVNTDTGTLYIHAIRVN